MSLYSTVQNIIKAAQAQPNVGYAVEGDVFDVMNFKDSSPKYSAVVISQSTHGESNDFRGYGFNIFYIDRLTSDQSNRLEIQSIAIEALSNITKALIEDGYEITGELRYHPFDEKFEDLCAGVYVEITISESEYMCEEKY